MHVSDIPVTELTLLSWFPPGIAVIVIALCLRFNRSRMFFSVLSVSLAYIILQWYIPVAEPVTADAVWAALCVLLPIKLAVFSMLKERGVLTWWGSTRFALLLVPMLLAYLATVIDAVAFQRLLSTRLFEMELIGGLNIYQGPMLVLLLVAMVLNGRIYAQTTTQNSTMFVVLLTSIMLLHHWDDTYAKAIYASSALIMMAVAVIQESWNMAYIDPLTNLPGRRALEEDMLKLSSNYTIAMLDIDHFKNFNDQHGHDAGDQVLSMVATRIRYAGGGSKAYRYGGEEFTLLFPGKKAKDVTETLDGLISNIAESKFQLRRKDRRKTKNGQNTADRYVRVTISAGVANRSKHIPTADTVRKAADVALYRAKKQGRNRVCK